MWDQQRGVGGGGSAGEVQYGAGHLFGGVAGQRGLAGLPPPYTSRVGWFQRGLWLASQDNQTPLMSTSSPHTHTQPPFRSPPGLRTRANWLSACCHRSASAT